MGKFSDFGVNSDVILGKSIEIEELFGKRILVEKIKVSPSKYPGKNTSGNRMQMQVVLADFKEVADKQGDFYVKDATGEPIGERRSCFTGSDSLMNQIRDAETRLPGINEKRIKEGKEPIDLFPMDTTIVKQGKCFLFT